MVLDIRPAYGRVGLVLKRSSAFNFIVVVGRRVPGDPHEVPRLLREPATVPKQVSLEMVPQRGTHHDELWRFAQGAIASAVVYSRSLPAWTVLGVLVPRRVYVV